MKLYIVSSGLYYEGGGLDGVFLDKEEALGFARKWIEDWAKGSYEYKEVDGSEEKDIRLEKGVRLSKIYVFDSKEHMVYVDVYEIEVEK